MKDKLVLALIVGIVLATLSGAAAVAPALAAPPKSLHIEVPATIDPDGDPFTASGPAVEAGLVCASGVATDLDVAVTSPPGQAFRILRVLKQFACAGSGGTFDVKLVVKLDLTTQETTANWNIVGGTGAYSGLHGNGKLVGVPIVFGQSILDKYDGQVH